MKKSLYAIVASLILATVMFFACNQGQQTNSNSSNPGTKATNTERKLTIQFDEGKIECTKKDSDAKLSSSVEVKQNEEYVFVAKNGVADADVLGWFVSGKAHTYYNGKNTFKYVVNPKDASQNNTISVNFNKKDETKIKFDENKIDCKKMGTSQLLTSGSLIDLNQNYEFRAKLGSGEAVGNWYVNNECQSTAYKQLNMTYFTRQDHINSENVIEVKFSLAGDLKIKFNEGEITCKKESDNSTVNTGGVVVDGERYKFSLINLSKEVRDWYVSGHEQSETGKDFSYTVQGSDANFDNIIEVRFAEKVPIKIQFDGNKMECTKTDNSAVASGSEVQDREQLYFKAKLGADKIVERWYVNGVARTNSEKQIHFIYAVSAVDAENANPIVISYSEEKRKEFEVRFEGNVTCSTATASPKEIQSGGKIVEGMEYIFSAQITPGKIVDSWSVNNKPMDGSHLKEEYHYRVRKTDVDSAGVINVSFSETDPKTFTLQFDTSRITCAKPSNPSNLLNTGTQVKEGERYIFSSKNLPAGQTIDYWTINGSGRTHNESLVVYTISSEYKNADNNILEVKLKLK